ncbi:stage II sporulation protein M [Methanonatronarchaeum sp. AMET6-2]|uniref:stage II sporulation protein M n=1 Tax=Methanonatronarchaeum sp. AMET6-2 TaxID=2933293 RepID=UPI00122985BD|nr:stage II sporulation protein M [Methanonatronarchaeum sp. AMET6-2]RZN60403.1 MAG: stage II sporulation protein M [Methanonatronarchaeia archaeon]UOY10385.1 stage II sporulation protein M [Methanonatronarchaeum sp. AMET6-2]
MSNLDFEVNIRESIWLYMRHITKVVPFFAFILGLNIAVQLLGVVGLGAAFSYLHFTEGLGTFIDLLLDGEFMLFAETVAEQTVFLGLIALTMLFGAVANLAGYSLIMGGFIELARNTVVSESVSVGVGLKGAARYFKRLFFLYLSAGVLGLIGLGIPILFGQFSIILGLVTGLLMVLLLLVAYVVFFLFAQEAIVIDDVGVLGGLAGSARFFRDNILEVIGYIIVVVAVAIAVGVLSQLFTFIFMVPIESMVSILMLLVVVPLLLILKVRMYTAYRGLGDVERYKVSYWPWIKNGFLRCWSEFVGFTKRHIGLFGVSIGFFLVGIVGGWYLGGLIPFGMPELELPQQVDLGVNGGFASLFLYLMFHNWTVAIGVAFGGIVFGLPTVGALVLNGGIVGVVAALIGDMGFVLAGILPHGVIEVPAIALAGAMGLKIALDVKDYVWGELDVMELGETIEKIMLALVGLFPLFAVAGIVEAFITPVILSLYTGTPMF